MFCRKASFGNIIHIVHIVIFIITVVMIEIKYMTLNRMRNKIDI